MAKDEEDDFLPGMNDDSAVTGGAAERAEEASDSEDAEGASDARHDTLPPPHTRGPFGRLMNDNFLQFASYSICDRALPTVEDGLKPVQRRIMHALWEKDDGRLTKVAGVVGNAMHYHPHGDQSIKDAIVVLANKCYLIEGQGNFGNLFTGDAAAASRYIECRLTKLAKDYVFSPKVTQYVPSYDGRNKEPVLLPSKLPLLLMLGVEGIAVGLSTSIMPHNFIELLEAEIAILQKKPFTVYPDFPTGGSADVAEYDDGRGSIKSRAIIEERKGEKNRLYITGIPWGTTTERLVDSIERVLKSKKIPIKSISDFTAEHVEIELVLAPGSDPEKVKKALFAFTECESRISSRIYVLRDNRPCEMTVSEILQFNVEQLLKILKAEFDIRLGEIDAALFKKTLERIFIEERIYKRIEQVKEAERIAVEVRKGFEPFLGALPHAISDDDIEQLLKIPIRRISLYDINRHHEEMKALREEYATINDNLAHLKSYAVKFLKNIVKAYAKDFPRQTEISTFRQIDERALTATELTIKLSEDLFIGHELRQGEDLFPCSSLDKVYVVWKDGRYKFVAPPDKMFVDSDFLAAGIYNRDEVFTCVYYEPTYGFAYIKRFTWGGMIQNKEYSLVPEKGKLLLFVKGTPENIYVKYKPMKNQRINQQIFNPAEIRILTANAKGLQMTPKAIAKISIDKPRGWSDEDGSTKGSFF